MRNTALALLLILVGSGLGAQAADMPLPVEPPAAALSPYYVHFGLGGIFMSESAKIYGNGVLVNGANIRAKPQLTPIVETGYYVTPNWAISFTGGLPPLVKVTGKGSIAAVGTLGKVVYGPTTLTAHYHFTGLGALRPYVGAGLVGMLVFHNKDGAFKNLDLKPNLGFAIQAGVDYQIDDHWSVFADVKKAFLRSTATGTFAGAAIKSKVILDPLVTTMGVGYRF